MASRASLVEEASFNLAMDDIPLEPPSERLAPVGAPNDYEDDDDDDISFFKSHFSRRGSVDDSSGGRLKKLEEEQEQLNSSLLALTTHFAQVQFKLTQVTQAPADDKEDLLKQLEDFAFRGCPDLRAFQAANGKCSSMSDGRTSPISSITDGAGRSRSGSHAIPSEDHEKIILLQREKQQELILQLKQQLEELESYAFECGADITPHSLLVEKQRVIIDELRSKVDLDLNDMNRMSIDELKGKVDNAIGQITQPAKQREQLVNQLKTQIVDLERFIEYLQKDGSDATEMAFPHPSHRCTCDCPTHGRGSRPVGDGQSDGESEQLKSDKRHQKNVSGSTTPSSSSSRRQNIRSAAAEEEVRRKKLNAAKRTLQMLQMFTVAQFGCGTGVAADIRASKTFSSSPSERGEAFIAMVERLESVVYNILEVAANPPLPPPTPAPSVPSTLVPRSRHSSAATIQSSEIFSPTDQQSELLVNLVRKDLYKAIVEILHHGLIDSSQIVTPSKSNASWGLLGCFPVRSSSLYYGATVASGRDGPASSSSFFLHPWLIFVKYYELKGGKEYNESPARKLSDAFGLDIVQGQSITAKHVLLSGIHEILTTHAPLKRSLDSQFKAFICLALNQKKLTPWIRLVMRTAAIVDRHYAVWSFMTKTNGEDLFKNLEKLKPVDFYLPVDMAVRSFRNINDAF